MAHHHHHHGHSCHGDLSKKSERQLWRAIVANVALTVAQVVGGLISGSLSLVADALHNFSDAASLVIAVIAVRIGRRPADHSKTFGYKRAETIAALINLTCLVMIGLYLMYEAVFRFFAPVEIDGWIVIGVAFIALCVDVYTAALVYQQSKTSMNMRAAFLHNVTDALASVGVIISGILILLFGWMWIDAVMALAIAGYVLWHVRHDMPAVIHLLMDGAPHGVNVQAVIDGMTAHDGVVDVHHVHIRRINEQSNGLEAHVVLKELSAMEDVKCALKDTLEKEFKIGHSTLEFETSDTNCSDSA